MPLTNQEIQSLAKKLTIDPETIQHWHTGEYFLKVQNPAPLVAHGWSNAVTDRSCLMGEAKLDRKGFGLQGCVFQAKKGGTETKWLVRDYNWNDWKVERCEFHDSDTEHAIYIESYGSGLAHDIYMHEVAAQGFQDAWRGPSATLASEVIDPEARLEVGTIEMRRWLFINVGQPRGQGRYGFCISHFEAQRCKGTRRNIGVVGKVIMRHRDGSGMFLAEDRPLVDVEFDAVYRSTNTIVNGIKKKREAFLLDRIDRINLTGHMEGGDIKIKRNSKTRYSVNVTGLDTQFLWVDGKKIGPLSKAWNG